MGDFMIIGKNLIELALKSGLIYCNPFPKKITEVSFNVTLGKGAWFNNVNCIDPQEKAINQFQWVDNIDNIVLLPDQMIIAHTNEFCGTTVGWLTPQIRSRSTIARWGFEVGTAALFGEPGFHSRWALELHNVTDKPIVIRSGWEVGQLIFQLTIGNTLYKRQYNVNESEWKPESLLPKIME